MGAPRVTNTSSGVARFVTGKWGSFWDVTTQTIGADNATIPIAIGQADPANDGVSIVAGNRVTFGGAGVYSITFSLQFANTDAQVYDAQVWLRKNGTTSAADIADSNSRFSVPTKHGTTNGHLIGTVNFVLSLAAGDYVTLMFSAEHTSISIETTAASGLTPTVPRTPGVILTATQV